MVSTSQANLLKGKANIESTQIKLLATDAFLRIHTKNMFWDNFSFMI